MADSGAAEQEEGEQLASRCKKQWKSNSMLQRSLGLFSSALDKKGESSRALTGDEKSRSVLRGPRTEVLLRTEAFMLYRANVSASWQADRGC